MDKLQNSKKIRESQFTTVPNRLVTHPDQSPMPNSQSLVSSTLTAVREPRPTSLTIDITLSNFNLRQAVTGRFNDNSSVSSSRPVTENLLQNRLSPEQITILYSSCNRRTFPPQVSNNLQIPLTSPNFLSHNEQERLLQQSETSDSENTVSLSALATPLSPLKKTAKPLKQDDAVGGDLMFTQLFHQIWQILHQPRYQLNKVKY